MKIRQMKIRAIIAAQAARFKRAKVREGVIWPAFVKVRIVEIAPYSPPKTKAFTRPQRHTDERRRARIALILFPKSR